MSRRIYSWEWVPEPYGRWHTVWVTIGQGGGLRVRVTVWAVTLRQAKARAIIYVRRVFSDSFTGVTDR